MTTLVFLPSGVCQGLYTEAIDLSLLGRMQVERFMRIEFENQAQEWQVFDRGGQVQFTSPSRETCLHWEEQQLTNPAGG